jgi:nucleoid-associated protein YgaU
MARSRYARTQIIDDHYGSFVDPTAANFLGPNILDGIQTVDHVVTLGDRLDTLAARYYGDDGYWWVIALANRIGFALSIPAGTILKIPPSVQPILQKIQR